MPLGNYTELQASVAGFLHRDDLDDQLPDFVALGESRIARNVRLRRMLKYASPALVTVAGTATVALPSDWLEFDRVRLASPDRILEAVSGPELTRFPVAYQGSPRFYRVEGANMVLVPIPDDDYTLDVSYYGRLDPLATTSSNWMLTEHPGLYLYASLAEGALFCGDDPSGWETKFAATLEAAEDSDRRAATSGSSLRMRSR